MRKFVLYTVFAGLVLVGLMANHTISATVNKDSGNVIVQTIPGPTVAQKLGARTKSSWPWYVTRGSGLIAAIILVVLMLSGIGQVTGGTFNFLEPLTAWASHRALGIAFGVSVLIHIFSLLFDKFVVFNLWQLLIPWTSNYKPLNLFGLHLGSIYVALGVLAMWGSLIVILTSLLWVDKKPHFWKLIHLTSYLILIFVFIHALYLGTDLAHGLMRWVWIVFGISVGIATMDRVLRAYTV